jgi:hypothetical protein
MGVRRGGRGGGVTGGNRAALVSCRQLKTTQLCGWMAAETSQDTIAFVQT